MSRVRSLFFLAALLMVAAGGLVAKDHAQHTAGFDMARPETLAGFFSHLTSEDFMPHGHCIWWKPSILWLHVLSNALIALAYFAIPTILLIFVRRRKDFPFPGLLALFAAFILLCGTGHVFDVITFWHPIYRLDGVIKALTAGVSVLTALVTIPLVPKALALRSPKELEALNEKLHEEIAARKTAQAALVQRADELDEANRKLREIDRLKDNFLSNVSHELRTPLTLILAPVESLLAGDHGKLSRAQVDQLQAMHNNSVRLYLRKSRA